MAHSEQTSAASGVVVSIGRDRYRTEVLAAGHTIIADEPPAVGGSGLGPGPYELLVAAVGACKAMTLRMYADRKGWALDEVICSARHNRCHSADCEEPDARLDEIHVELQVVGDLSDEQRGRLLEIAGRCPVHRSLDTGVRVTTSLVDEG